MVARAGSASSGEAAGARTTPQSSARALAVMPYSCTLELPDAVDPAQHRSGRDAGGLVAGIAYRNGFADPLLAHHVVEFDLSIHTLLAGREIQRRPLREQGIAVPRQGLDIVGLHAG